MGEEEEGEDSMVVAAHKRERNKVKADHSAFVHIAFVFCTTPMEVPSQFTYTEKKHEDLSSSLLGTERLESSGQRRI